jgi:hypothetical protein
MSIVRHSFPFFAVASLCVAASLASGCGSTGDNKDGGSIGNSSGGLFTQGDDSDGGAVNLPRCITATNQCVASCSNGGSTTVSGTVYDPAGRNPLYGVVVYVPSVPPAALQSGAGCYSCASLYSSGMAIANAVTDASGKFTLTGVPDGANIPLVVQVGKWRMQYVLPNVSKCQDNDAAEATKKIAAPAVLRLPKNHTEGDIPNFAISTGAADSLECLLSRIGVEKAEYGSGTSGAGKIHIFQGYTNNGANTTPAAPIAPNTLWTSKANLMPYDIVMLTCEGEETIQSGRNTRIAAPQQQVLFDYAAAGGRVFASHFHYKWFSDGPFAAHNLAQWFTGSNAIGDINANVLTTLPSGGTFPRGVAMQQWLTNVNALTNGQLPIQQARRNAWVTAANTSTLPWIVADPAKNPMTTEYLSFDTPFDVASAEQCGRVVYSDLHVGAASGDYGEQPGDMNIPAGAMTPSGCADNALSPQEKALEFMLFDLSGCITPPDQGAGGVPVNTK